MNCSNCGTLNPEGARFCSNCGNQMSIECQNCATRLTPKAKFCHNCGHPVQVPSTEYRVPSTASSSDSALSVEAQSSAASPQSSPARIEQYIPKELLGKLQMARANRSMAGERRIVTVLFCDVKGSTAIAEQLDPEEWAEIMNGAFKYLIAPVYKYEGTLARLMGDAILAFFGAPIAHEDDPQRAVLAGLEIVEGIKPYREQVRKERGFDFDVRVGINTGLVVVGEVGSDLRVEYTAMGDAVNLASRMEQNATPGSVHISGNTYKSVHNLFHFEPLGEIEVKGKTEPVAAYRVLGAREGAVPTRGIEGLSSALVGRDTELQTLKTRLEELRDGCGQIISVMGEAGLGKSRLIAELRKTVPTSMGWYEGRSLSYETTTPYAPFNDIVKSCFDLNSEDSDSEKYRKILAGTEDVLPGQGDTLAPFIASLLGIKLEGDALQRVMYLEPPALRGRVSYAVAAYIEALAMRRPLVLLFEDLHWSDPTSLELLESLLPVAERTPLIVIALFRPHSGEPSWRFHEIAARNWAHRYTQVMLQPLDEGSARQLVANLLEIEDLPERVRALILSKAEGNPFYVEEVIRSLLDSGLVVREEDHWRATREIENIAVPDTLAGVITARLDRLDDDAKSTAQTAAVVGREFRFDVLREVYEMPQSLEGAVTTLQRRELVRERSRMPSRVYAFKHVLTQETAYASVLLSRRRELHRRVAETLERVELERVNDIARHFMEARERERALPYLVEAGERAARAFARDEAIGYFRQAIEIAQVAGDVELARRAYEGLGKTLEFAMDVPGAAASYQQMLDYAEGKGDVPMKVSALNKLSNVSAFMMGEFEEATRHLDEAERLAREADDMVGMAEMYTMRCGMCTATADFGNAEYYLSEAVEAGRKMDAKRVTAFGLAHKAQTQTFMTEFDAAWRTAQEALEAAEEVGDLERRSEILAMSVPQYQMTRGDLDSAIRSAEESYELGMKIGLIIPPCIAGMTLGTIAQMRGEYEAALEWHERSIAVARPAESFLPFMVAMPLGSFGAACIELSEGLADRAQVYHRELLEILKTPFGAPAGGTGWTDLGFCALALGELEHAKTYFDNAITMPSMQMYMQRPRMLAGAALAALAQGRLEDAEKHIEEACDYAEQHSMKHMYPLVYQTRAEVCAAKGDHAVALDHFMRAEVGAAEMKMRPALWQVQAGMAKALLALGRPDEAAEQRRQAIKTIGTISALFRDQALCSMFTDSAMKRVMARTNDE